MKILIAGSAGFLGKNLYKRLGIEHEIIGIDKNNGEYVDYSIDITDEEKIRNIIKEIGPDIIIDTAAISSVDYCESNQKETYNINVNSVKNLINGLDDNVKFIFISSDYVYDGIKGDFDEESLTNPINYYGKMKREAELIVREHKNHLILRPTVVFGIDEGGKNFFMQLLENQKEKKLMMVPADQYSNPIYINLLVEIINKSISKDLTGTFITTGPETINRYDFALKICKIFNFDESLIKSVQTKDLKQVASRPLNCGTNSSKIRKSLEMEFPSLEESLLDLKNSL